MCKSENEPGGPYRCPGHARASLSAAAATLDNARVLERTANAEYEAIADAHAEISGGLADIHERLRTEADADEVTELNASAEMYQQAMRNLDSEGREAKRDLARSYAMARLSEGSLKSEQAKYDATTDGLADISRELHQAELSIEGSDGFRGMWKEKIAKLKERRTRAETRMAYESDERFERWVGDSTSETAQAARSEWLERREAARRQLEQADDSSRRLAAELGVENVENHITALDREISQSLKYAPYAAAEIGAQDAEQGEAWEGVASIQRKVLSPKGEPVYEVTLSRVLGDERTRTSVKIPVATLASTGGSTRGPSTTDVMNHLHESARRHEDARGDRKTFYAMTGMSSAEFDSASKAHHALGALLGDEGRAFAFDMLRPKQLA